MRFVLPVSLLVISFNAGGLLDAWLKQKELTQLQASIASLVKSSNGLLAANQTLLDANNQLAKSARELMATNEELRKGSRRLVDTSKKLMLINEALRHQPCPART